MIMLIILNIFYSAYLYPQVVEIVQLRRREEPSSSHQSFEFIAHDTRLFSSNKLDHRYMILA